MNAGDELLRRREGLATFRCDSVADPCRPSQQVESQQAVRDELTVQRSELFGGDSRQFPETRNPA